MELLLKGLVDHVLELFEVLAVFSAGAYGAVAAGLLWCPRESWCSVHLAILGLLEGGITPKRKAGSHTKMLGAIAVGLSQ